MTIIRVKRSSRTAIFNIAAASVSSPSQAEGDSGSTNMVFTVSLSGIQPYNVRFDYATRDGTAVAGSDYVSTSGSATIAKGQTSTTVNVPITGDTDFESDEIFYLDCSNFRFI